MGEHEIAAERALLRRAREDPHAVGSEVARYLEGVATDRWPGAYRDALGQPHRDRWLTPPQILQWVVIHDHVERGELGVIRLDLGQAPGPDRDRARNAEVLRSLPAPFTADLDLDQHAADDDGSLGWSGSMPCRTTDEGGGPREVSVASEAPIPLEVGACLPSRVRLHLLERGAVARWPYGSDAVYVLVGLPSPMRFALSLRERVGGVPDYDQAWAAEEAVIAAGLDIRVGDITWTRDALHDR